MSHVQNHIVGVETYDLREISDERGAVLHMIRNDSHGFTQFGECYFSEVRPGAIKAWKRHSEQTQNLTVPVGCIRIVLFDSRDDSSSRNSLMVLELGRPDSYKRLCIPPGIWYGFTCTSDSAALIANFTDFPHDPDECEVSLPENPDIPYTW